MTNDQKDIVGIAEEFRDKVKRGELEDYAWEWIPRLHVGPCDHDLRASQLAEALLLAVEALETIEDYDEGRAGHMADRALRKIRSLSA